MSEPRTSWDGQESVSGGTRAAPEALRRTVWVHPALFLATLATSTWAGALHQGVNLLAEPSRWPAGLPYALALLAILGIHELGHYVVAKRSGVRVSLPYFIPAPIWLGTFGAFIRMDGPIRNRSSYFDVGIAGPLAGLVVALAAFFFGLVLEPPEAAMGHGLTPASSYLFAGIYRLAGGADPSATVQLGPVAFAGWLGLMITALNLLPVGQLDGGHVAYGVLGPRSANSLSVIVVGLLVVGGLLARSHLLMWGLFVWFVAGTTHPVARDEATPVGGGRVVLALGALALLLSILLPVAR